MNCPVYSGGGTLYTMGFVEYNRQTQSYFVQPYAGEDFSPIEIDKDDPFCFGSDLVETLDTMKDEWFDEQTVWFIANRCKVVELPNRQNLLKGWTNSGLRASFETEDLRKQVILPPHVEPKDVIFIIFTSRGIGDEDGILKWCVFYPVKPTK